MKKFKNPQDIQCLLTSLPYSIYISNIEAARNINTLKHYNIGAVITIARGALLQHSSLDLENYLYISAQDHQNYDISKHFQQCFVFIERNIKKYNILIHCFAGVSRSATIIISYLMKKQNKKFKEIYNLLKNKRKIINPNKGFIQQLNKYESTIIHKNNLLSQTNPQTIIETQFQQTQKQSTQDERDIKKQYFRNQFLGSVHLRLNDKKYGQGVKTFPKIQSPKQIDIKSKFLFENSTKKQAVNDNILNFYTTQKLFS